MGGILIRCTAAEQRAELVEEEPREVGPLVCEIGEDLPAQGLAHRTGGITNVSASHFERVGESAAGVFHLPGQRVGATVPADVDGLRVRVSKSWLMRTQLPEHEASTTGLYCDSVPEPLSFPGKYFAPVLVGTQAHFSIVHIRSNYTSHRRVQVRCRRSPQKP